MEVKVLYHTTEYECAPEIDNEYTEFIVTDKSVVINILDAGSVVLSVTEIELSDAIQLAKIILALT